MGGQFSVDVEAHFGVRWWDESRMRENERDSKRLQAYIHQEYRLSHSHSRHCAVSLFVLRIIDSVPGRWPGHIKQG